MNKPMSKIQCTILSFILMLSFAVSFLAIPSQVALATGTTYYINNQAGSNCNNAGAGTSQTAPWCDFTNINSQTFVAGDQILLARGATWNQEMHLTGSGTSTNYITLDAYGSGANPIINRSRGVNDRTIYMTNPSYWKIQNLEISNAAQGIAVYISTLGNQGLIFNNLYIHDIDLILKGVPSNSIGVYNSTAIIFTGTASIPNSTQWWMKDVEVSNVITSKTDPLTVVAHNSFPNNSFQGIRIHNNNFTSIPGDISIQEASNVKFFSNKIDTCATAYQSQGTTCVILWQTQDITFSNNIFNYIPNTSAPDMSVVDHEAYNDQVRFRSNYIAGAAGPGLEWLALSGRTGDYNTNHEETGNAFSGNNTSGNTTYKSSLLVFNISGSPFTGTATDNLYYELSGFLNNASAFSSWTLTNNKLISSASNIYNAGNHFSSIQNTGGSSCTVGSNCWSYQLFNGTSYSNLSYDSTNQWWGTSTGYVTRFDELPNSTSNNWVARAWTAPTTGTVSIRGRVHKNEIGGGDGVKAKITKNGSVIWPTSGIPQTIAYNDQDGYNTNLDSVSVTAGDVIRFEVNNGSSGNASNDTTSWAPTVAY